MALSTQIGAYVAELKLLDQAVDNPKGIRVQVGSDYGKAVHFNSRLQQARTLDREETKRLYPREDVRWNKSPYDVLTIRKPVIDEDGVFWIYIERPDSIVGAIEPLSEEASHGEA